MANEPAQLPDPKSKEGRFVLSRALRQLCRARGLGAANLKYQLDEILTIPIGYQTVAGWGLGERNRQRNNNPSEKQWQTILQIYPEIREGVYTDHSTIPPKELTIQVRRRDLPSEIEDALRTKVKAKATDFLRILPALPADIIERFILVSPVWERPAEHANELRLHLQMGERAPLTNVEDLIEQLGIPIVRVEDGSADGWTTLAEVSASGLERTVTAIAFGGRWGSQSVLRHALLVELGFFLILTATRARAKHVAATHFADELLAPTGAMESWLLGARVISRQQVHGLANTFGAPVEAIQRQCLRMDRKVVELGGDPTTNSYLEFIGGRTKLAGQFISMK